MRPTSARDADLLRVDAVTGLVACARYVPSPNRDQRPPGQPPELVVVHGISLPPGEFGGPWIERLFTNTLPPGEHPYFAAIAGQRVSAHVLIRRDGSLLQFVPFHLRAWHAGASSWRGREQCNDYSIGIELEGTDTTPYEDAQYGALATLVAALVRAYPTLAPEAVAGHEDVAPGRKTDPGPAFEWPRLKALLRNALALPAGETP
jgi:N-acetyl-anhydromuramoyl-L-alanine amidase